MRLIIEDLEGSTTVVNLGTEEVTIGRKPHNTIQLTEQNVSRSHAKLIFQDEGWLIHDLGSYNGVKVNGVPISGPTQLHESDLIQIGDYHLTLTDDVDRETVDIERPRAAANDGIVAGAMSSSSDLPSMSVEDLEPMRPPGGVAVNQAHVATAAPQKDNKGKLGVIIGVVGTLVAVIAIAILVANSGGDDGGSKDEKAAAQTKDVPDEQPEPAADAGPTPVPEPEPVPEVEDTAAPEPVPEVEDTAAPEPGEDDGELVAETGVEEEPEPEPEPEPDTSDKPKPKPKPKLPPDQALAEARKASLQGNNRKAYNLAKDAYDQNKSGDALNLMGVAACKMGSASKAKSVHRKMTAKDKGMLEKLCGSLGIEL